MKYNLDNKAENFQNLIEKYFIDDQELIKGAIYKKTKNAWPKDYFDKSRDFLKGPNLPPPEILWAYEQTNMCNGFYLLSLVYKYMITKDPLTEEIARRTFNSIVKIYDLSPIEERGFLSKPYGGKISRETHADQYFPVYFGLKTYYDTIARIEEKNKIKEMIVQFAEWWIKQDYKLMYFNVPIELKGKGKLNLLPLYGIAYSFSSDVKFLTELKDNLDEIEEDLFIINNKNQPKRIRSPFGRFCGWFMSINYLLENSYLDLKYGKEILKDYWIVAKATLADDYLCYVNVIYNKRDETFELPGTGYIEEPLFQDNIAWDFIYWSGILKSAYGTAGFSVAGIIVNKYLRSLQATKDPEKALLSLKEEHFSSYIDGIGGQLDKKHEWLLDDLKGDAITLWLFAYWWGRYLGNWK